MQTCNVCDSRMVSTAGENRCPICGSYETAPRKRSLRQQRYDKKPSKNEPEIFYIRRRATA